MSCINITSVDRKRNKLKSLKEEDMLMEAGLMYISDDDDDEDDVDILPSEIFYSEFDEDEELVRRQVKIIKLSHHADYAKNNEKRVNDAIMEIYQMDNFKAIKNINYIAHAADNDGIQCIIEYTIYAK